MQKKNRGDEKGEGKQDREEDRGRKVKGKGTRLPPPCLLLTTLFGSINPYALRCRGEEKRKTMTPVLLSPPLPPSPVFSIFLCARASGTKSKQRKRQSAECTVLKATCILDLFVFLCILYLLVYVCVCDVPDTVCKEEQAQA